MTSLGEGSRVTAIDAIVRAIGLWKPALDGVNDGVQGTPLANQNRPSRLVPMVRDTTSPVGTISL